MSLLLFSTSKTPPFSKDIVFVEDIDSTCITVEDIAIVDTTQADTEATLAQLTCGHHFSLSRYPLFSLAEDEGIYSLSHHELLTYKI